MRTLLLVALLLIGSPARADETPPEAAFAVWLQNYSTSAEGRGLKREWLDQALAGAVYLPRVIALDRTQPDDSGVKPVFQSYLARQLTTPRIEDGKARAAANAGTLKRIAGTAGVPPEIIVAIWGMETSYGRITGNFDLPSALATLAFDGRRAALFTRELDAAVRMVGEGRASRSQMKGSWAGAFGQPQFLPSSYLAHAKDGNGDGRADIWGSEADTFASIAAYLANNGWKPDTAWGFRTIVPVGFDRTSVANPVKPTECIRPLERHSRWLPASEWRAMGFRPVNAPWPADATPMSLVEPDGPGTAAYLTSESYRAILRYNCSNFYALSVVLLADAVQPALRP